jgi:hypothetical protein
VVEVQGAATIGQADRRSKRLWVELGLLFVSCAVLLWLNRGERGPEPLQGAAGGPAFSFALAAAVAWLAPGYVLCRLGGAPWQASHLQVLALSLGAGLAWLILPASIALRVGTRLDVLAGAVAGLNAALVAAYAATRLLRPVRAAPAPAERPARASPWLAAASALALAQLLVTAVRRPRFTAGSDEWILMGRSVTSSRRGRSSTPGTSTCGTSWSRCWCGWRAWTCSTPTGSTCPPC